MRYDASKEALFHPEKSEPLFGSDLPWTPDAVCAELSRLAYIRFEEGDGDRLDAALARGGFGAAAMFNDAKTDAQGFGTIASDGTRYLAYRGTQPDRPRDLISDARFWGRRWAGSGRVHTGFLVAEQSLAAQVDAWLALQEGPPPVATGHSLGAAMATITAARLPHSSLVTFGSPRVGNAAFRTVFEGRTVRRYVDCCDVVTTVPPAFGYGHIDGELYIDRAGHVLPAAPGRWARLKDKWAARRDYLARCAGRPGNVAARELADHAPINYVGAVLGVREGP
jgi:pimeloyl-ACP methyl ester carboxylesterase